MTIVHWVIGIWVVSAIALFAFELGFLKGTRIWDLDGPWKSTLIYAVLILLSPFVVIFAVSVGVIEYSRINWGRLVRLDVTTADAVQTVISAGDALARDIRDILEDAAVNAEMDITPALDTPLSVVDGGSGNTEPGSLLKAACVGTVAAVGIREMYVSGIALSQTEDLHCRLARAITAWEVGQDNIGRAPNPWSGKAHMLYPPGALTGGKKSIANKLMEEFIATGDTPREENARLFSQMIIATLGLASPICTNPRKFPFLHQLGLGGGPSILPGSVIDTVAERILAIDPF